MEEISVKKALSILVLLICMFCTPITSHAGQNSFSPIQQYTFVEKTEQQNGLTVEYKVISFPSRSRSNSRTAAKTKTYKKNGKIVATVTLTADFTYNGSSATCTSASSSYSTYDGWNYSNRSTTRSKNTAATSAKISKSSKYFNANITMTCSKTGEIS